MASPFVLELRDVSSLTEARFAAGEGFTHIRLSRQLASGPVTAIQEIKGFLSGIEVGAHLEDGQTVPEWADYHTQDKILHDKGETFSLVPPGSEGDMNHCLIEVETVSKALPETYGRPAGLSLPGAEEYKTGHADFEPHQEMLDLIRTKFGI